jgi:phage tail tape-measure protein
VPINPENLKTTLDNLHQQLAEIDQADPAMHEQLVRALAEIQNALDGKTNSGSTAGAKPAYSHSLIGRLREAATHFEESHPSLAGNIGSLIVTLGRSGI